MSISKTLRFRIFQRDSFTCQYCGRKAPDVDLEVDHIHPRSKGGPDDPLNLRTACHDCNRGKRDAILGITGGEYRLTGGPLHGRYVKYEGGHPLVWVVRDGKGQFHQYMDRWSDDTVYALDMKPHRGHPLEHDVERWQALPKPACVEGAYFAFINAVEPEFENGVLRWADLEMLLRTLACGHPTHANF